MKKTKEKKEKNDMLKKILIAFAAIVVALTVSAATASFTTMLQNSTDELLASGELDSIIQDQVNAALAEQSASVSEDLILASGGTLVGTESFTLSKVNSTVYSGNCDAVVSDCDIDDNYYILYFDRNIWDLGVKEVTVNFMGDGLNNYHYVTIGDSDSSCVIFGELDLSPFDIVSITITFNSGVDESLVTIDSNVKLYEITDSFYNYAVKYVPVTEGDA